MAGREEKQFLLFPQFQKAVFLSFIKTPDYEVKGKTSLRIQVAVAASIDQDYVV